MKSSKLSFALIFVFLTAFIFLVGAGLVYAQEVCELDADCPIGEYCDGGICQQACESDAGCSLGEFCFNGICLQQECELDADCPIGEYCDNGICTEPAGSCNIHYDCQQGEFCYYDTCLTDPQQPVYHCGKEGCPPGEWCVEPEGARSTCAEDESYACEDTCDCGPAHACIYIPEVEGKRCIKDIFDPWKPGGIAIFDTEIPEGEPTYCCTEPSCLTGKGVYDSAESEFSCYDKYTQSASNYCGGKACFYAGDCEEDESCLDVYVETTGENPRPGTFCSAEGGRCFSDSIAEAAFGWQPSYFLKLCEECTPDDEGKDCEAGWKPGGAYITQRVIGTCGTCSNGTCDEWETYLSCPQDCPTEFCGDSVCGKLETPKNCPVDCGPYPVCGDGSCDEGETESCEGDCGCQDSSSLADYPSLCGDGFCDANPLSSESCATCPADCGAICPVALCKDVTVNSGSTCTVNASIDNGSYMADGSQVTLAQFPAGPYLEGDTIVTLTATNSQGGSSQCVGTVTVLDNSSPQIENLSASPSLIWPPNHKFVNVEIQYNVSDSCGGTPVCSLSVVSNEPVESTGDGKTSPDWRIFNSHHIQVRAERDGDGAGRVYTTTVMCVDDSGNESSRDVMINVPVER